MEKSWLLEALMYYLRYLNGSKTKGDMMHKKCVKQQRYLLVIKLAKLSVQARDRRGRTTATTPAKLDSQTSVLHI